MQRTYLFVPPEEDGAVLTHGAHWDDESKRWYINADQPVTEFAIWLPMADDADRLDDDEFTISSGLAYVAEARTQCQQCKADIDVICIHCESGTASDEPLVQFTVSHIWAVDAELSRHLRPWPNFRQTGELRDYGFANYCPHCGARQDDLYLHTEPGDVFFDIPSALSGRVKLLPILRTIRLSGEEHFQVT